MHGNLNFQKFISGHLRSQSLAQAKSAFSFKSRMELALSRYFLVGGLLPHCHCFSFKIETKEAEGQRNGEMKKETTAPKLSSVRCRKTGSHRAKQRTMQVSYFISLPTPYCLERPSSSQNHQCTNTVLSSKP